MRTCTRACSGHVFHEHVFEPTGASPEENGLRLGLRSPPSELRDQGGQVGEGVSSAWLMLPRPSEPRPSEPRPSEPRPSLSSTPSLSSAPSLSSCKVCGFLSLPLPLKRGISKSWAERRTIRSCLARRMCLQAGPGAPSVGRALDTGSLDVHSSFYRYEKRL